MAQQTAVDYFAQWVSYHKLNQNLTLERLDELITNAKQMEKEQIFHAFGVGCHVESTRLIGYHGMAEQYYNETYGK